MGSPDMTVQPNGNGSGDAARFLELARRALGEHGTGDALRAVAALRRELDRLESLHVAAAVHAGWSWSRVARELGVTKQAAHRKHAQRVRDLHALGEPVAGGTTPRLPVADETRRAIQLAREEAGALGAGLLGPEHLLLGVLRVEAQPAVAVLEEQGVSLEAAREAAASATPGDPGQTRVSGDARATMDRAVREAVAHGDSRLRCSHLLLALAHEQGPYLRRVGADPAKVIAALDS
jgi:Clp amino terminal domain, pathogenicity island component